MEDLWARRRGRGERLGIFEKRRLDDEWGVYESLSVSSSLVWSLEMKVGRIHTTASYLLIAHYTNAITVSWYTLHFPYLCKFAVSKHNSHISSHISS